MEATDSLRKKRILGFNPDDIWFGLVFIFACLTLCSPVVGLRAALKTLYRLDLILVLGWLIWRFVVAIASFAKADDKKGFAGENRMRIVLVSLLAIAVVLSIVSVVVVTPRGAFSFDYIQKFFMMAPALVLLYLVATSEFSKNTIRVMLYAIIAFSVAIIITFAIGTSRTWYLEGREWAYLTLNATNSNQAGLMLVSICVYLFYSIFFFKSKTARVFLTLDLLFMVVLLYLTSSRNPFFAIFLGAALTAVFIFIKKSDFGIGLYSAVVMVLPLILASIYVLFYITINPSAAEGSVTFGGKSLESRLWIWVWAFKKLTNSPLHFIFGSYYEAGNGTGIFHAHNSILDLWLSYGIGGLISIVSFCAAAICFMIRRVYSPGKRVLPLQVAGLFGCVTFLMLGCAEACPFYSGDGIFVMLFSSYILLEVPVGRSAVEEGFASIGEKEPKKGGKTRILVLSSLYGEDDRPCFGKACSECFSSLGMDFATLYMRGPSEGGPHAFMLQSNPSRPQKSKKLKWATGIRAANEAIEAVRDYKPDIVDLRGLEESRMNFPLLMLFLANRNVKVVLLKDEKTELSPSEGRMVKKILAKFDGDALYIALADEKQLTAGSSYAGHPLCVLSGFDGSVPERYLSLYRAMVAGERPRNVCPNGADCASCTI